MPVRRNWTFLPLSGSWSLLGLGSRAKKARCAPDACVVPAVLLSLVFCGVSLNSWRLHRSSRTAGSSALAQQRQRGDSRLAAPASAAGAVGRTWLCCSSWRRGQVPAQPPPVQPFDATGAPTAPRHPPSSAGFVRTGRCPEATLGARGWGPRLAPWAARPCPWAGRCLGLRPLQNRRALINSYASGPAAAPAASTAFVPSREP